MFKLPEKGDDKTQSKLSDSFVSRGMYTADQQSTGKWATAKNILKYAVINPLTAMSHVAELGYMKLFDEGEALKQDAVKNMDDSNDGKAAIDAMYNGRNLYEIDDLKKRLNYWNIHNERLDHLYD